MIKLTYRPMKIEDATLRFKWENDLETNKYLGVAIPGGTDLAFHKNWVKCCLMDDGNKMFIVEADGRPIGMAGLRNIDKYDSNGFLTIIIGEAEFRGKGLGKEVTKHMIDYGFDDLELHKIWLDVHVENIAGVKCYTACGFVQEGRLIDQVSYGYGSDKRYADEFRMMLINPKDQNN